MLLKKLILLVVTIVLISYPAYAATLEAQNASVTGNIRADDGVGDTVSNSSLRVGPSGNLSDEFYWYRTFIRFDLTGQSNIQTANLHLFYQITTTNGSGATFDVNIQSIEDVGNLAAGDFFATKFTDINALVFDNTLDKNVIIDVTDAWNAAIDGGRDYLTLMFVTNDEPTFSSATNWRYLEFCDVGETIGVCDSTPTNPLIETTAIPAPVTFSITGSARTVLSLVPLMGAVVVVFLVLGFFILGRRNESVSEQVVRFQDVVFSVIVVMVLFSILTVITDAVLAVTV